MPTSAATGRTWPPTPRPADKTPRPSPGRDQTPAIVAATTPTSPHPARVPSPTPLPGFEKSSTPWQHNHPFKDGGRARLRSGHYDTHWETHVDSHWEGGYQT